MNVTTKNLIRENTFVSRQTLTATNVVNSGLYAIIKPEVVCNYCYENQSVFLLFQIKCLDGINLMSTGSMFSS